MRHTCPTECDSRSETLGETHSESASTKHIECTHTFSSARAAFFKFMRGSTMYQVGHSRKFTLFKFEVDRMRAVDVGK